MHRAVLFVITLLVLSSARAAVAQTAAGAEAGRAGPTTFAEQYQHAMELYKAERYSESIAAFEAAYALNKDPKLLINIGRAHHKLGHAAEAISSYARFLQEDKNRDAPVSARVNAYIEEARALLGRSAGPPPPLPPQPQQQPQPSKESTPADNLVPPMKAATAPAETLVPREPLLAPGSAAAPSARPFDARESGVESKPIYKRWWLWTAVGLLGAAAIVIPTAIVLTKAPGSTGASDPAGLDVRVVEF